ncbi:MAG: DUF4191 domain-containing protein [Nitriliruptorales bacterium]|nr:DUF4191 domain-containing protein [Nitriliruptorales bacterium]
MRERLTQLWTMFQQTRQVDNRLIPYMVAGAVLSIAVFLGVGFFLGAPLLWGIVGFLVAGFVAVSIFGRRAQKAQLAAIEGEPGAAAAVLNSMRGQWFVTPVVAATRKQELVHRVVGRPGVILVGEGRSARVKQLLAQEKKRHGRATGEDVPVHTVIVGPGEKEVALNKLQWHVQKLPRELKKTEVPKLERKLAALNKDNIPMPKGYVPNPGKKIR